MPKVISVEDLEPGLVLAKDVKNIKGLSLIKKGALLEEKHAKILKRWGIASIEVSDGEEELKDGGASLEEQKQLIEGDLDHMFNDFEDDDVMMQIKQSAKTVRLSLLEKE